MSRKPKGGRNWEGFGADPTLQAVGARQTIKGIQEQGVIATIKHLIGNEQEMYRMYNPFQYGYSANIGKFGLLDLRSVELLTNALDDRTLHELYLWPFAEGVHAGVGAVMTAYNAVCIPTLRISGSNLTMTAVRSMGRRAVSIRI